MMDRQLWQEIRFRILARSPLSLLRRLTGTNLIIPYYHIVSDEEILHVKHLYQYKTTTEFKEDLDFLLKNYLPVRSEEHTSELQSQSNLVCRLLLEKKKK